MIRLLSAGHGPVLYCEGATGRVHALGANSLPLGIVRSLAMDPVHEIELASGDLMVMTTDGFIEWTNPGGEEFGMDRLNALIAAQRAVSPDALIEALYAAVQAHSCGTRQIDDLTAVVIKRV